MLTKLLESLGHSNPNAAAIIVPHLIELFHPRTVIDFGCGSGTWLREFRARGVTVVGYDKTPPKNDLDCHYCDLETTMPTGAADLALCLEVGEHLSPARAPAIVAALATYPVVVFAAGVPLQGGWHHVNEQWPDYWAKLFNDHGYLCSDDLRWTFWDHNQIPSWYRQDLLVFAYPAQLTKAGLNTTYPRAVIHPDTWLHIGLMGLAKRISPATKFGLLIIFVYFLLLTILTKL